MIAIIFQFSKLVNGKPYWRTISKSSNGRFYAIWWIGTEWIIGKFKDRGTDIGNINLTFLALDTDFYFYSKFILS